MSYVCRQHMHNTESLTKYGSVTIKINEPTNWGRFVQKKYFSKKMNLDK